MNVRFKETLRTLLPTRTGVHRIQRGFIRGARICTSWHDYPGAILGTTEAPLLAWFAQRVKPGETWLDVGAHYGYTSIALARLVGEGGRVFAFEPVAATAGCIEHTRELNQLNQLRVVPFGLSADPEIRPHRLPVSRGMAESIGDQTAPRLVILAISLDSLWESLSEGNAAIHGIKIDVQGMEGEVLAGMRKLLCRWHPKLVVEFHHGVDRGRVLDGLGNCGYNPIAFPVGAETRLAPAIEDDQSYGFFPSPSVRSD